MTGKNSFWGFAKVRPGALGNAAAALIEQKFEVWAPRRHERIAFPGGKAKTATEYLLPQYIFVKFEETGDFRRTLEDQAGLVAAQRRFIHHVFVDAHNRPLRISWAEYHFLRNREETEMGDSQKRNRDKAPIIREGMWVRIENQASAYNGNEGQVFTNIRGKCRVDIPDRGAFGMVQEEEKNLIPCQRPAAERHRQEVA